MDIENLECGGLKFAANEQARSDSKLLDSHEERPVTQFDRLWLEQACLRAVQIDAGEVELVSGEDVDRRISELLR